MASFREVATLPRILGLVVVPAASLVVDHELGTYVLTAVLMTVYVTVVFAFLIDHRRVPSAYIYTRQLHFEAKRRADSHPILLKRYNDGVHETESLLRDIINSQFEYDVTEVPDMSIYAMEITDGRCLLTFPLEESENFLLPRTGSAGRYYKSMLSASQRIKDNGRRGVVRVFILSRQDDISPSLVEFMQENENDGIHVRVIFEERLPLQPEEVEYRDFGCYETTSGAKWIMALRKNASDSDSLRYIVNTNSELYDKYRSYGDDVINSSMTLSEFKDNLLDPMNGRLWPIYFAQRRFIMNPPHGLSDEDADYIVESALRKVTDFSKATVLVLGFTPKLISRLLDRGVGNVISVDQCKTKPREFSIKFETDNWLRLKSQYDADAIVFDESLNNLSRLQLSLFFSKMSGALKLGGVLIGRAMGRFDSEKSAVYAEMTQGRVIELLRKASATNHDEAAPLIICLLHTRVMSFNETLSVADCETWNSRLTQLRNERYIDQEEYSKWSLPFNFKLLSPDQNLLMREASVAGLNLAEMRQVQGQYVQGWPDTEHFYRIVSFESS